MNLIYTRPVLRDIDAIHAYLFARSPDEARHVAAELQGAIEYVVGNPAGSPPTDEPRVHAKWVNGYRYKIFYRLAEDAITLLHVHDTARREWRA